MPIKVLSLVFGVWMVLGACMVNDIVEDDLGIMGSGGDVVIVMFDESWWVLVVFGEFVMGLFLSEEGWFDDEKLYNVTLMHVFWM